MNPGQPLLDPAQWVFVALAALFTAVLGRVYTFAKRAAAHLDAARNCPVEHQCLLEAMEANSRAQLTATIFLKHATQLLILLIPDADRARASQIQQELAEELSRAARARR